MLVCDTRPWDLHVNRLAATDFGALFPGPLREKRGPREARERGSFEHEARKKFGVLINYS